MLYSGPILRGFLSFLHTCFVYPAEKENKYSLFLHLFSNVEAHFIRHLRSPGSAYGVLEMVMLHLYPSLSQRKPAAHQLPACSTRPVSEYYKFCRVSDSNSAHFSNFSVLIYQDEVISHVQCMEAKSESATPCYPISPTS